MASTTIVGSIGKSRSERKRPWVRFSSAAAATGLWLTACVPLATPHIQDAPAPGQYMAAARPRPSCEPAVELVRSQAEANRPYREVASLSATCYPGVPTVCERKLLDRACELEANAVILIEPKGSGTPPGATSDSMVSRSAIAVRWTTPEGTR